MQPAAACSGNLPARPPQWSAMRRAYGAIPSPRGGCTGRSSREVIRYSVEAPGQPCMLQAHDRRTELTEHTRGSVVHGGALESLMKRSILCGPPVAGVRAGAWHGTNGCEGSGQRREDGVRHALQGGLPHRLDGAVLRRDMGPPSLGLTGGLRTGARTVGPRM